MKKIEECTGVYGIYLDNVLVYIGKTTRGFGKRFKEHKHFVDFPNDSETQFNMYADFAAAIEKGSSLQLRPLIIVETAKYKSLYSLTNRDIESMEFALISAFQPKYNIEGKRRAYRYTN